MLQCNNKQFQKHNNDFYSRFWPRFKQNLDKNLGGDEPLTDTAKQTTMPVYVSTVQEISLK